MDRESLRAAIFEQIAYTANLIIEEIKQMPVTGKRKRNIFIKVYNRRPMNKHKRVIGLLKIALTSCMGAIQIARIQSTPIPKYSKGK